MKYIFLFFFGVLMSCNAQNDIYDNLKEAPLNGGLQMDDYWVWGSSVIKGDDGKYHMYASRWPKMLPFHPGWMIASEIVHATSETPEGPYKRLSEEPIFRFETAENNRIDVEDPYIWWSGKQYEAILKDRSGEICGEEG